MFPCVPVHLIKTILKGHGRHKSSHMLVIVKNRRVLRKLSSSEKTFSILDFIFSRSGAAEASGALWWLPIF